MALIFLATGGDTQSNNIFFCDKGVTECTTLLRGTFHNEVNWYEEMD